MLTKIYKIFLFSGLLFFFCTSTQAAVVLPQAKLILASDQLTVKPGAKIKFSTWLNASALVSAVGAKISYDRNVFDILKVSKDKSIVNLWVQEPKKIFPPIGFGGGIMYPGFEGVGELFNFELQVRASTTTTSSIVSIINDEALSSDGSGLRLISTTTPVTINISTTSITKTGFANLAIKSATHSANNWSNNNSKIWFNWPAGYQIAYGFNSKADTVPVSSLKSLSSISFDNVKDGTYYLHLKFVDQAKATKVLHYKVMLDTKKPTNLLVIKTLPKKTGDLLKISMKAKDVLSGIAYYNIILDGKGNKTTKSAFSLVVKQPGSHRLTVRVFDKAGNFVENNSTFVLK